MTSQELRRGSFRGDYHPGGATDAYKRRQKARKAGIASGIARRQRSTRRPTPRARSRQQALALAYKIRQVDAAEFEERYQRMCDELGITFDRRGLNSLHTLYKALLRSYRAQGQDWESTNAQMSRAMEIAGRGRCKRTVQRLRKRLVAMGLIMFEHVRRSGALRLRGQMDTLRCRCLNPCAGANVTPPSGARARASSLSPALALPATAKANCSLIPPPSAADDVGPAAPALSARERLERDLSYVQLKIDMGWGKNATRLALDRARLRQELRYVEDVGGANVTPGSGQEIDLTFRKRSEGFR